jgi:hypothetical protein
LGCNMDDLYAINSAKTEFREAFNTGNPERLIALLDAAFVYMPDGVSWFVLDSRHDDNQAFHLRMEREVVSELT